MARLSSDLLITCLDDIRAGRRTVDDCVRDHPQLAGELRRLVGLALAVRLEGTPHLDSGAQAHGRARLLAAIASNGHHAAEDRRMVGLAPAAWLLSRRPRWLAALGGGLGALVAGGAVVYAAQGAPPDSPLYPVQQAVQVVAQAVNPPTPTPSPTAIPTLSVPPPAEQAAPPPSTVPVAPPPAAPRLASPSPSRASASDDNRGRSKPSPSASADARGRGRGDDSRGRDKGDNGDRQAAQANAKAGDQRGRDDDLRVIPVATPTITSSADRGRDKGADKNRGSDGGGSR